MKELVNSEEEGEKERRERQTTATSDRAGSLPVVLCGALLGATAASRGLQRREVQWPGLPPQALFTQ